MLVGLLRPLVLFSHHTTPHISTRTSPQCDNTFDSHTDKVWALAVREDGRQLVTGGGDSLLQVWRDVTTADVAQAVKDREAKLLKEQELLNAMRAKEYVRAIRLAIELKHPQRLLTVLQNLIGAVLADEVETEAEVRVAKMQPPPTATSVERARALDAAAGPALLREMGKDDPTGVQRARQARGALLACEPVSRTLPMPQPSELREALSQLSLSHVGACLRYAVEWNANAKHAFVAQTVISVLLDEVPLVRLHKIPDFPKLVSSIEAYSERHFARADRCVLA